MRRISGLVMGAVASVVLLSGCATGRIEEKGQVDKNVALAKQAVEQAQTAGAVESAPVAFNEAQNKLSQAEKLFSADRSKDYPRANQLAQQAEVDARVALAQTRAAQAQNSLAEVQQGTETLREEIRRKTDNSATTPSTTP